MRPRKAVVVLASASVAALTLAACGTRLSNDRLYGAARLANTPTSAAQGAAPVVGAPASTGTTPTTTAGTGTTGTATTGTAGTGTTGTGTTGTGTTGTGTTGTGTTGTGTTGTGTTGTGTTGTGGGSSGTGTTGAGTSTSGPKSGGTKTSAPAGTATTPTCTGTKSTISIASIGAQSGFAGQALAGGIGAIRAGVAAANAHGGISCHPIKYYVYDDGGNPSQNQSQAAQAVEQNHVIAEVFSDDPFGGNASVSYMSSHKIPVIGSEGGGEWFHQNPYYYSVAATGADLYKANFGMLSTSLTPDQKAHVGVEACIEAAICSQFGSSAAAAYAKSIGLTIVYSAGVSLTQPDYTSTCQSAKNAGAQVMFVVGDGSMLTRSVRSCRGISFTPQFASSPVASAASVAQDPDAQNVLMGSTTIPWTVTSNPAVKEYVDDLNTYTPGLEPSGSGAAGWASWLLFRKALSSITSDNPTSADLYNALNTVKDEDFGGFTGPLTYPAGQNHLGPLCWWTIKIVNQQWTSPDGGKRSCA